MAVSLCSETLEQEYDEDEGDFGMFHDSEPDVVDGSGSNLGDAIDTGRLVVQQINNPKGGQQSYLISAPEVWMLWCSQMCSLVPWFCCGE